MQQIPEYVPPGSVFDQNQPVAPVKVSDEEVSSGMPESISLTFWPRPGKLGGNKQQRLQQLQKGRIARVKGLVGFAPFPILDQSEQPLGACMVVISTAPLTVTENPLTGGRPYQESYTLGGTVNGDMRFDYYVSSRITNDPATLASIAAAVAAQGLATVRSFEGDRLYVTFNPTIDADIAGPSCGLATYVAAQGYASAFYYSGELATEGGVPVVRRIAGLRSKIRMLVAAKKTLVAPILDEDAVAFANDGISWSTPAESMVGAIFEEEGTPVDFVGIGDLGSVTVVAIASMSNAAAPPLEDPIIPAKVSKPKGPARHPVPEGVLPWPLKANGFDSRQDFDEFVSKNGTQKKSVQRVIEVSQQLRELASELKVDPDQLLAHITSQLPAAMKVSDQRVHNLLASGAIATLRAMLAQAAKYGVKASKAKGPARQEKKVKVKKVALGGGVGAPSPFSKLPQDETLRTLNDEDEYAKPLQMLQNWANRLLDDAEGLSQVDRTNLERIAAYGNVTVAQALETLRGIEAAQNEL